MTCSVGACANAVFCRGWCQAHYRRWYKGGDVRADVPLRRKNGTGTVQGGYIRHGHEYEHRAVAGLAKGDGLHVHHVDLDPSNNDPSNLVVLAPTEHQRLHHVGRRK